MFLTFSIAEDIPKSFLNCDKEVLNSFLKTEYVVVIPAALLMEKSLTKPKPLLSIPLTGDNLFSIPEESLPVISFTLPFIFWFILFREASILLLNSKVFPPLSVLFKSFILFSAGDMLRPTENSISESFIFHFL